MNAQNKSIPRIYIDARMVSVIPHGIARYVTALASGLRKLREKNGSLPYELVFLVRNDFKESQFMGWPIQKINAGFLSRSELFEIPKAIRGAALYHSPSFSSLFSKGPLKPPCPWVVTIHDLNHLRFGSRMQKIYYRFLLKPFAKNAAQVVTVSEFSRHEIAQWMSRPAEEIAIAYNALDEKQIDPPSYEKCEEILSRYQLESGKYFLCLSNSKPHKNIPFLVKSYREASLSWPLVLSMEDIPEAQGVPGVRPVGGLSDTDVRALRACAGAVVFPSLYEGFGLPPVEAVVAHAPLIVSRIPPHAEGLSGLGGDEVTWFDPFDPRSLAQALKKASEGKLTKPTERARHEILHRFSEAQLAGHMDRIYRRVLELPS
jgi:glycosyltransferase involved in cell wall biosynthesis